ncbi:hypothetical protein [Ruminococcus gauvreauii]
MNEIVLELILMVVMAFFMSFGLAGCWRERKKEELLPQEPEEDGSDSR